MQDRYIVTCEHASNRVAPECRELFAGRGALLRSHRAYDPGALALASALAGVLRAPLFAGEVTRLVVDLNRAPHNWTRLSRLTWTLPAERRAALLRRYYWPYRRAVQRHLDQIVDAGQRAVHVSVHSFTPVLRGQRREVDLGLLFDPSRPGELALARRLRAALRCLAPRLRVRFNAPYRGITDALTAFTRRRLCGQDYVGVEIELSQRFVRRGGGPWRDYQRAIVQALAHALWSP